MTAPIEALVTALEEVYQSYLAGYVQRRVEAGPFQGLEKFIRGNSTPDDRRADNAFYRQLEEVVAQLDTALAQTPDPAAAARAVRRMALEAEGYDPASKLMIEAVQALAIPLVSRLTTDDRRDILAAYQARYPKKRMLTPRQRELLAALAET